MLPSNQADNIIIIVIIINMEHHPHGGGDDDDDKSNDIDNGMIKWWVIEKGACLRLIWEMHCHPNLELLIHHYHPNDDADPDDEICPDNEDDDGNGSGGSHRKCNDLAL